MYIYVQCPGGYTADHWRDVEKLELEPRYEDYVEHAFHPLGVYLNFWQPKLAANAEQRFAVMMVNDEQEPARGSLTLTLESADGRELARVEKPYDLPGLGQQTYNLDLRVPAAKGACLLKAAAQVAGGKPVLSRRKVTVQ